MLISNFLPNTIVPGWGTTVGLPENHKTPRRTPLDATDRRKTPQNTYFHETPMYYGMFYTLMYEWKPISNRKIQHKYRYKIPTEKMRKSVNRRKMPQDVTDCRKTVTLQYA